jgi:hypothetical protein
MSARTFIGLLSFLATASAWADDVTDAQVKAQLQLALEQQARVPRTPPALPSKAAERAHYVHDSIAFGKWGAATRAEKRGESSRAAAAKARAPANSPITRPGKARQR